METTNNAAVILSGLVFVVFSLGTYLYHVITSAPLI